MRLLITIAAVLFVIGCKNNTADNKPGGNMKDSILKADTVNYVDTSRFVNLSLTEIKNFEFAEVLLNDSVVGKLNNDNYLCKIIEACNGPADPDLEYCNCSFNYYIANGAFDLPPDFKLFKLGPFYGVDSVKLLVNQPKSDFVFNVYHHRDSIAINSSYHIFFDKIIPEK
jgi:hypothetical protein